ncbi:hypothetical protein D3C76_1072120 [compost metagenome]
MIVSFIGPIAWCVTCQFDIEPERNWDSDILTFFDRCTTGAQTLCIFLKILAIITHTELQSFAQRLGFWVEIKMHYVSDCAKNIITIGRHTDFIGFPYFGSDRHIGRDRQFTDGDWWHIHQLSSFFNTV